MKSPTISPVAQADRIFSLDVLRGFAILGILIMNIQSFSMIEAAYLNPTVYGDLTGINKWVWIISHCIADGKFITLFSILFGAGIILFSSKLADRGVSVARFHYSRTFWLIVIGLVHAYLLWYGDILFNYGLCALILYFARNMRIRNLLIVGIILLTIPSLLYSFFGLTIPFWPPESIDGTMVFWHPGQDLINTEVSAYQSGWMGQMAHRIPATIAMQTIVLLTSHLWKAMGLMMIGMAFFKSGILSGEKAGKYYRNMVIIGFLVGFPLIITGIILNFKNNWSLEFSMYLGWQFNYWGSLAVALGYIGIIILVIKRVKNSQFLNALANTGRSALTNYLAQTILCTFIFYGNGFGLFGMVDRIYQILIVFAIWAIQLSISSFWFRYFRFGPAEWIWRSLTYFKFQPFRKNS